MHQWTPEEIQILTENYKTSSWEELTKLLPNRPKGSLWSKASKLKITKRLPVIERFLSHVEKTETCWIWKGRKVTDPTKLPYGKFNYKGTDCYAHRVSYELFIGPIPDDKNVLHTCDNPPCVRPDHFFLGTHQDNSDDMVAKGRSGRLPGSRNPTHKLLEVDAIEIREKYTQGLDSQRDLAREYRVDQKLIWLIVHNQAWNHLLPGSNSADTLSFKRSRYWYGK